VKHMNICILTTSFPAFQGHTQSPFILELAKSIAEKHKVHVVCPNYQVSRHNKEVWGKTKQVKISRFQYAYPKSVQKLTSEGGIPTALKTSFLAKLQFPFFVASMFWKARKPVQYCDVIHAQWALSGLVGVFLKKIYNKPLVLTTRGAAVNLALQGKLSRKVLLYVLKHCSMITPNNYSHEQTLLKLGIPQEKIKVIPNGIHTAQFKPVSKKQQVQARKKLELPLNKKIVLCMGWLIPRKGQRYLLDALPDVIASNKKNKKSKDLLFVIVGSGVQEEELKQKVKRLKLQKRVLFVPSQPPNEIPRWMHTADIFILPSLSEGRPNVVPEALSSGVPVIATHVNGTPEFIENRKNGLLIPPKDSKAIAQALNLLLKKTTLYAKLKKNARKSILQKKLGWETQARKYYEVYSKVTS
jgi:teichuronic acid biosynthesis glycosyltransferase TuaC